MRPGLWEVRWVFRVIQGELPVYPVPGNPVYLTREGWSAVAKARREDGSTTSTMMRTEISTPTMAAACKTAFGAAPTPGAADRPPSTLTMIVSHIPHFLSIHKPAEATRPATPSTTPE